MHDGDRVFTTRLIVEDALARIRRALNKNLTPELEKLYFPNLRLNTAYLAQANAETVISPPAG